MLNPIFFKLFLIFKLPLAFVAGVKLKSLNDTDSTVQLKYGYLNKNPFKSIYFAALSMAGELASGMLAASFTYKNKPVISMLVVGVNVEFSKKAVGLINFTCNQGKEIETIGSFAAGFLLVTGVFFTPFLFDALSASPIIS